MIYAIINNGVVENTIVADETFVSQIQIQHEAVVRIDNLEPQPGIGWNYSAPSTFTDPQPPITGE